MYSLVHELCYLQLLHDSCKIQFMGSGTALDMGRFIRDSYRVKNLFNLKTFLPPETIPPIGRSSDEF